MAASGRDSAVVRVRRIQERIARAEVAGARRALHDAERSHAQARARYEGMPSGCTQDAVAFRAERDVRAGAAAVVLAGARTAQHRQQDLALRMTGWSAAHQRLEAAQRLQQRRRERAQAVTASADRRAADDLATVRYVGRSR